MPTTDVNGVEIYYEVQGSGETVLLVPPNWWPCATWNVGVVPFLSKRYRTLVYDGRGTGRSGKPKDGYTVRQFSLDGIELLRQLGVSRSHLVGFAIGGQIVEAMAIERPELVASLTISTTGSGSRRLDGKHREVGPEALNEIEKIGFEKYILEHIDNDHMAYNPEFYHTHRAQAAELARALWSGQSMVEQYRIHELARLTWDTLAEAPKLKVPTLVLCGADDGVERRGSTPVATAKRLAPLIPGAELSLIPKVRHMTFWDGDGALIALQDFLGRHPIR
jgi:pimeloyl-ACP methyl ester carboxylesterase